MAPTPKTNLACDTCRQRKSRCDGVRPICTHCRNAGRECTYRPTPTSLEADNYVLSRLTHVEARLKQLEERSDHSRRASEGLASTCHSTPSAHATSSQHSSLVKFPELHTAAACKMLVYWPRIRINFTVPGISAANYLSETDHSDATLLSSLSSRSSTPTLMLWQVSRVLEDFYDNTPSNLPVYISELIQSCPKLSSQFVANNLRNMFGMDMDSLDTVLVDIKQLPISILLVLSIALRSADNSPLNLGPELLLALSEASFTNALQSQWTLLSVVDDERIPLSLLMAYCLMYFWARPFHALGLVQSLDPVIRTFSMRNGDESLGRLYYRLHYIIECDILTEVDGIPSDKTFEVLTKTNDESMSGFLESHLWLRSHLNKVLQYLYSTSKAYAQPHELADLVCNLSADLRGWFQSQPLGAQFARDATAFSMSVPTMPLRKREIALRYFACAFLLHRPVLYFFLHKDMEYTVRPPDTQALRSDQAPWILESCRDCIEGATLFVHFSCISMDSQSSKMERSYRSWCDIQLLFAAYLVLVQVKSVPALVPIFRVLGDMENLLDQAERMFELFPIDSLKIRKSLEVLRSQRQNLDAASPVYSHGSV